MSRKEILSQFRKQDQLKYKLCLKCMSEQEIIEGWENTDVYTRKQYIENYLFDSYIDQPLQCYLKIVVDEEQLINDRDADGIISVETYKGNEYIVELPQ